MSFSSDVKEEISKLSNLADKEIVKYELLGYLATDNITIEKSKLKFCTESEYSINRFSKLLNNLQYTNQKIEIIGKRFYISVNKPEFPEIIYKEKVEFNNITQFENKELLEKAFVRGAFLGGGSINNPKSAYHLEVTFSSVENAKLVLKILEKYQIQFKSIEKKSGYSIYTKDGDEISKLLALIGANSSVLKFEEIRVYRDIRNSVNRKVNCETANLNKTVNAALKQIEDINYLKQIGQFKKMPEQLQEIANLRLENPEASLVEIGKMLSRPIGKSGVNHRFQNIEQFALRFKRQ
jgi:DNA-binding protein WhiA